VLRAPELDAGLPLGSHQRGAEGQNPLPRPAGHTAGDAAQGSVGLLGCECTWLGHAQLFIHQYPQVLLGRAALNPFTPQPVVIPGVALTQVQDLAFGLVEPHEVHTGLILEVVQVPLEGIPLCSHLTTRLDIEHPRASVHTGSRRLLPAACTVRGFQARTVPSAVGVRRGKTCCEIWEAQKSIFLAPLISTPQESCFQGCYQRQTEPGRCRGTLCHITLLFRERYYSTAPDLPSLLPYLISPAALDQSLHIDLTPSQHLPPRLSPHKTSTDTLSLGSAQQAGRGVCGLDAAPPVWLRKSLCPFPLSEAFLYVPVCMP